MLRGDPAIPESNASRTGERSEIRASTLVFLLILYPQFAKGVEQKKSKPTSEGIFKRRAFYVDLRTQLVYGSAS